MDNLSRRMLTSCLVILLVLGIFLSLTVIVGVIIILTSSPGAIR